MRHVVFIVPYAMDATLRFVRAAARQPGVRLAVVSQEAAGHLPAVVRECLVAHHRITDCMDPDQLEAGVRAVAPSLGGRVDAVLAILEQLQVPLAQVRERLGIPGMDVETARRFRDKALMKDVLRAHDLPCARHCLAKTADEARAFSRDCGFPLVVKPPAGAGAKNTFRIDDLEQLEQLLETMPPDPDQPTLLEEFITGIEHSFDSVSVGGRHVFHSISKYTPTPLEVMQTPWIQWCVMLPRHIDGPEYRDIGEAGRRALDCLGMGTGLTHMEWFRRPDGSLAISEVAARPPGAQFTTLLSYAHDLDFYSAWAALLTTGEFRVPERRYAAGAAYLRGQGEGKVVTVEGLEEAQRDLGELVVESRLPRPQQTPSGSYEGEGYVIVRHPETAVVEDALARLVTRVRVQLG